MGFEVAKKYLGLWGPHLCLGWGHEGDFVLVQDGLAPMLSRPGKHILELGASWWGVQAFWNLWWLILCINQAMWCPVVWSNTSLNTGCEGIF